MDEKRCGNPDCNRIIRDGEGFVLMPESRIKDGFLVRFDVIYCFDCDRVEYEILPPYTGPNPMNC